MATEIFNAAGLIVDLAFVVLGLIPAERDAKVTEASITFNYTSVLIIVFLMLAGLLIARFMTTGGPEMVRAMEHPMPSTPGRGHHAH